MTHRAINKVWVVRDADQKLLDYDVVREGDEFWLEPVGPSVYAVRFDSGEMRGHWQGVHLAEVGKDPYDKIPEDSLPDMSDPDDSDFDDAAIALTQEITRNIHIKRLEGTVTVGVVPEIVRVFLFERVLKGKRDWFVMQLITTQCPAPAENGTAHGDPK